MSLVKSIFKGHQRGSAKGVHLSAGEYLRFCHSSLALRVSCSQLSIWMSYLGRNMSGIPAIERSMSAGGATQEL